METTPTAPVTDRSGETETMITKFDPNYQGEPSDKFEVPENQNVLEEEYDRGPFDLANMPTTPEPGAVTETPSGS